MRGLTWGGDDLVNQLKIAIIAVNVVTTLMAMGIFGAALTVQDCRG